ALNDAHTLRRQIELVGDQLRVGRRVALPRRLRTDGDGHAAVALKLDIGGLRPVVAACLDINGKTEAAQAARALRLRGALGETLPVRKLLRARHDAGEVAGVVHFAGRRGVG